MKKEKVKETVREPPQRIKYFAFILYEENRDVLQLERYLETHAYTAYISPLHTPSNNPNTDDNEGDETGGKPHYHVLVALSSPRTLSSVETEFNAVVNKTACFNVGSVASYTRYMLHRGYNDKEQFERGNIGKTFGGFPLDKYLFDKVEDFQIAEFTDWVFYVRETYPCVTFQQLIQIMREERLYQYIAFAAKNTYFVRSLL